MKEKKENQYVKRSQKDYSYAFKLQVIEEIESGFISKKGAQRKYGIQGDATIRTWLEKYGNLDWENKTHMTKSKSPEQHLLELEQKVKL